VVGPAVCALRRASESEVAGAWHVGGWPKTKVPDSYVAFRKQMQQEAAKEFMER